MGGVRGRLIKLSDRQKALELINEAISNGARMKKACELLDISIRTLERWKVSNAAVRPDGRTAITKICNHKLTKEEKEKIISISTSKEFIDLSPCQIVPELADRGEYIASESSFYRVFRENKLNAHRGKSKPKTNSKPKSYIATKPNEIWSWDITYLLSNIKGKYFYLYLILDIFSRKIVGFEVYDNESAENASVVAELAYLSEKINGKEVILHSDNGSPMKGATMLATLQRLGIIPSFSRPSVSNDNPFSESIFKTLKYCPQYPSRPFENLTEARNWVANFVKWYNNKHKHSAIKFVTPNQRHQFSDIQILKNRKEIYEAAKTRNPARWSGETRNWEYIEKVSLNPEKVKAYKF